MDIQSELSQAESCLKQMEIEVAGITTDKVKRLQYEQKVRQYKRDLDEAKHTINLETGKYANQKSKETMMGANLEEVKAWDTRQRLIG